MATSVLSKEAGLKGKLERCEKRKKETRQNKKKNNTNKETLSFCEENSRILVHFLEQTAPLSTSFGTLRYQDGDGNWNV